MAARLGNVIYWLGLVAAVVAGLLAVFMFWSWHVREPAPPPVNDANAIQQIEAFREYLMGAALRLTGISIGSWLIGRIARYVLAGR
jgi:cell division protein FtsX